MKKKMLIAVDGSMHANQGLVYMADFLAGRDEMGCTLIHVQPMVSEYFLEEAKGDPKVRETLQRVMAHNNRQSAEVLEKSKQLLVGRGVKPPAIETVGKPRGLGMAKDILEYGSTHRFDAIVAGRRGLARIQKIFMGSVSSQLVEHSGGIPVCIVDGDIRPKKFLVAVDISAPWQPMLDQLAGLCAGLHQPHFTFYHVMQNSAADEDTLLIPGMKEIGELIIRNEKQLLEKFWDEATRTMTGVGFGSHQLELLAPHRTGKIGKMITEHADANNYDTVLVGRRGGDRAYYFGSTSRHVLERLSGCAVWVLG